MSEDGKSGVKSALEATDAAGAARRSAAARADLGTQGGLFGEEPAPGADRAGAGAVQGAAGLDPAGEAEDAAEQERIDAQLPLGIGEAAKRGPGRPKGARNRRTDAVAEYLVKRYGDPLEGCMAIGMRPLPEVVEELKAVAEQYGLRLVGKTGSVMDIVKLQMACLEAALPYIHARRAPEDGKGEVALPILNIHPVPGGSALPGGGQGFSVEDFIDVTPTEENQGLSGDASDKSDGEKSDE